MYIYKINENRTTYEFHIKHISPVRKIIHVKCNLILKCMFRNYHSIFKSPETSYVLK